MQYIIVGGIAVNLLGGIRGTANLDILVKMTDGNLRKIVTILKKQGYVVRQPVDPMGIADKKTRYEWIHQKKMEWLRDMQDLVCAASSKKMKKIRLRVRKNMS